MAWIESHQDLEEHPKILWLCNKTGWNLDEAIGKLHRLWWWSLKYAEDGDLNKYEPSQYLVRLNSKLNPQELYEALQEANFIEKNGLIHDWLDYAGRYLTAKYRTSNPKRLKEIFKKHKSNFSQTKDRLKSDNQPYQPNHTKDNQDNIKIPPTIEEVINYCQERNKGVDPHKWFNHYQAKGWLIGRNKMKDWKAAVRTWEQNKDFPLVTPKRKPVRIQVLEMKSLKIDKQTIKTSLLGDGYSEAEIDEAMGKEF
jgi:hypothetical protein